MMGWTAAAEAYDRSFVTLCDGAAAGLIADLPAGELLDADYFADPDGHLWETAYAPPFPVSVEGTIEIPEEAPGQG
ncbi:hypothetical protein [Brachybacterium sp. HMSC06H03]|uniref:hypothetical protein n=1 Tax=Brachybacterium sp. HMSC06H03 TaxID=1581127 RepID=UPI00114C8DEE|nr:hypothetical protein [Brachybacterium sp. HMSC06H03]